VPDARDVVPDEGLGPVDVFETVSSVDDALEVGPVAGGVVGGRGVAPVEVLPVRPWRRREGLLTDGCLRCGRWGRRMTLGPGGDGGRAP
jgi:hypothetical protein